MPADAPLASSSRTVSAASSLGIASAGPLELSHHESLEWAPSSNQTCNLRHRTEYERIRTLGRGAFGTTHLVKNVVDSRLYALKSIRLGNKEKNGTEMSERVLREVDALSALRSENVVRYYAAWVERGEFESEREQDENDGDGNSRGHLFAQEEYNLSSSSEVEYTTTNTADGYHDELSLSCTCNLCNQQYTDWIISYEQWGLISSILQPLNLCTNCYKKSIPRHIDASAIDIREKHVLPECLYILMEYAGSTLGDVMKTLTDSSDDDAERWSLFAQCVQGLYSIHEEGYHHRDIKPGNIFVRNGVAKIGDLGLARYCRTKSSVDSQTILMCASTISGGSGSTGVGTLLYSAPEVEKGNYENSDIYSLGIVLIELFSNFTTIMERVAVLGNIRVSGDIPQDWASDTDQAELARSMVNLDPKKRPSAREILEHLVQKGLLVDPDSTMPLVVIKKLQKQVGILEQKVLDKEEEAEQLRQLLKANHIDIPQSLSGFKLNGL